jgi:hypothetical protein
MDWTRVFEEPRDAWAAEARELDAARDAGRFANELAKAAAEEEREYQTAWAAGRDWAEAKEEEAEARAAALALLAERRKAKAAGTWGDVPAICRAVADSVAGYVETIRESRAKRRELAAGDWEELIFWPGEERLQGAFCEAAGLDAMPV